MQFASLSDDDLRNPLSVHFVGEVGRDDGGVTRDWYSVLAKEIFNPQYALFTHSAVDDYTFQINPNSGVNPDHLDFFRYIGTIVGKALYDGCLFDAHFTRLVYKRILDKPVTYHDMASVDVQFYKSLCWVIIPFHSQCTVTCLSFSDSQKAIWSIMCGIRQLVMK